jgi:hypothetical protein
MTEGKDELLADQLEAAIEAWHDCAPSGQGEGWSDEATDKFNAMARAFYDNSETICAALRRTPRPVAEISNTRNATLEEAAMVAIHHSNYGHVEGNSRAFKIADDIRARKSLQEIQPLLDKGR